MGVGRATRIGRFWYLDDDGPWVSKMDEKDKKAFDFAADLTKQPTTLATGTIALTITFSKDFLQKTPASARLWALWAWGVLLASVVFGIWTMMALTGSFGARFKRCPERVSVKR